jgi:transaldolase
MYIFKSYGVRAEVIVASIRNRNHLTQAAMAGADIATIPYKVLMDSLKHPLTDQGIEKFLKDWEGAKK